MLDIDQERRALEELALARETLAARVLEEVKAREDAQTRLAQAEKMTALGQLAGGIAHDFNNILQGVSRGAALIGRYASNPDTVRRFAQMIEDAARRGTSITRRLLSFARRGELQAEPVNLAALVKVLSEMLQYTLGTGIAIRTDVAPGLPPVLADRG